MRQAPGLVATAAVILAALVPELRFATLAGLVAVLVLVRRSSVLVWPVAAVIPAAVYLCWGALPQPSGVGVTWCGEFLTPPVVQTVGGALVVFAVVALLAWRLKASGSEIGLVRPSARMAAASLIVGLAVALGSLALGTMIAGPFFGTIELKFDDPRAIVPALIFALASGSMQEVAYRGSMLSWLTPGMGARAALWAQAIAFGASHVGPDFIASPIPVLIAVAIGGTIAGYIVQRYRSLVFVIAVHAAFDIPLYYVAACRLT